jgi:O-antigen ligase
MKYLIDWLKQNWFYILFIALAAFFVTAVMVILKDPIGQAIGVCLGAIVFLLPILLKNPEFGLALVGFFLPFERFPSIDLGGLNVKINYILILIVLLVYIFVKGVRGELKIPRDPIRFFVFLFLALYTISFAGALNQSRAIQVWLSVVLMVLATFTVTLIAQDEKAIKMTVKGILWGGATVGLIGLYQFMGDMAGLPNSVTLLKAGYDKGTFGFARVQAVSEEPLYFANYIFIPALISLILLLRDKVSEVFSRFSATLLIIILLTDFVLALSRGAILAAGIVFVLILIFQAKKIFRAKVLFTAFMISALVLTGAYLALVKSEPRAISEFVDQLTVKKKDTESVVLRLTTSSQAMDMFKDKPIFGVGPGNFGPASQGNPTTKPEVIGWRVVNNVYLEVLAESGVVGFGAFMLMILVIFIRSILAYVKAKDDFLKALVLGLTLAFMAILIQYATFSPIYVFHFWFLIGLVSAVSNVIFDKLKNDSE